MKYCCEEGSKDKIKDKVKDNDRVLKRPYVCYVLKSRGLKEIKNDTHWKMKMKMVIAERQKAQSRREREIQKQYLQIREEKEKFEFPFTISRREREFWITVPSLNFFAQFLSREREIWGFFFQISGFNGTGNVTLGAQIKIPRDYLSLQNSLNKATSGTKNRTSKGEFWPFCILALFFKKIQMTPCLVFIYESRKRHLKCCPPILRGERQYWNFYLTLRVERGKYKRNQTVNRTFLSLEKYA